MRPPSEFANMNLGAHKERVQRALFNRQRGVVLLARVNVVNVICLIGGKLF